MASKTEMLVANGVKTKSSSQLCHADGFAGFVAFIVVAVWFLASQTTDMHWQEKVVFSAFFAGAILCLGFSWLFHTVYCHSEEVGRLFCK